MTLRQRLAHPLNVLLPDLNNVPQRRQAVGAIVASLVVHLLLLLLFLAMAGLVPDFHAVEFKRPTAEPQPLEVQIISLPEPSAEILTPAELAARAQRAFIDSAGLAKSTAPPLDAVFESDQDMQAASEKAPTGDAPLPSQDGKNLPFQQFETKDVILGSARLPPADLPLPSATAPAPTVPPPSVAPEPSKAETAPVAKATPPPLRDVVRPDDSEIAVAEKAPVTRLIPPQVEPRPMPAVEAPAAPAAPPQEMARLVTPPPRPMPTAPEAGFQAQTEKTRIDGAISNRGKAAVDAVKTPLAVYKKQVNAAIGSRWYFYVKQRRDLISLGSAKLTYAITKQGRIVDVKIVENTSNTAFGLICEQSIREAEIGPPPDEAQAAMNDGRLEGDLTFTYYAGF